MIFFTDWDKAYSEFLIIAGEGASNERELQIRGGSALLSLIISWTFIYKATITIYNSPLVAFNWHQNRLPWMAILQLVRHETGMSWVCIYFLRKLRATHTVSCRNVSHLYSWVNDMALIGICSPCCAWQLYLTVLSSCLFCDYRNCVSTPRANHNLPDFSRFCWWVATLNWITLCSSVSHKHSSLA